MLPSSIWDSKHKIPKPSSQTRGKKLSGSLHYSEAEAEVTSQQEYQCPSLKETAQAVTVNDFYLKKWNNREHINRPAGGTTVQLDIR